jgi:GNAT superfamily N-acetyltransferase
MEFQELQGDEAKAFVKTIQFADVFGPGRVDVWLEESDPVKCYIALVDKEIVSVALLSKLVADPYKVHKNPYKLYYVNTTLEERQKGYAKALLKHIKEDMTTFVGTSKLIIAEWLLESAGFNQYKYEDDVRMYRRP